MKFSELYTRSIISISLNARDHLVCGGNRYSVYKLSISEELLLFLSILFLSVVFQPIQHNVDGTESWFTDGGTLDNYPVHMFDG